MTCVFVWSQRPSDDDDDDDDDDDALIQTSQEGHWSSGANVSLFMFP